MMFSNPKVVRKMNLSAFSKRRQALRGKSKMKNSIGCRSTKGLPTVMFHDSCPETL